MQKTVYVLNADGAYNPEICRLSYPLISAAAAKWGADFYVIEDRLFPDMPVNYEKFQIYQLGQQKGDDWSIYFDADTLVSPDAYDPTEHISKSTVMMNDHDMANNRFKYDDYFRRDGRDIGAGTWFCVNSDWTRDLWHPMQDQTLDECLANIQPTVFEVSRGLTPAHLLDDYLTSRNIAKYGLKFKSYKDLTADLGRSCDTYFWHEYCVPDDQKIEDMKKTLEKWGLQIGG